MLISALANDADYANASGENLYDLLKRPDTLVLPDLPPSAAGSAFLAHCILCFAAGDEQSFSGCEVVLGSHFAGEPLATITRDLLRALFHKLDAEESPLEARVAFAAADHSDARMLFSFLCAFRWESQLLVHDKQFVCNMSHDDYIAFFSADAKWLHSFQSHMADEGFTLVKRSTL